MSRGTGKKRLVVGEKRLLCTVDEETYKGLLVIPDSAKEAMKASNATVVQVGEGCNGKKAGDKIYFGKYAGAEVEVEGVVYFVIADEEVLVTVTGA